MKQFGFLLLAVMGVACSSDSAGDGNGDSSSCLSDPDGSLGVCDDEDNDDGDLRDLGQTCTASSSGDQGDCAADLVCKRAQGDDSRRCHEPCNPEALLNMCGTGRHCALDASGTQGLCVDGTGDGAGDGQVGEGCLGSPTSDRGDCAAGLVCKREEGSFVQRCYEPCDVGAVPDPCGFNRRCALDAGASVGLCVEGASLPEFAADCEGDGRGNCAAGLTCFHFQDSSLCVTACSPDGSCPSGRTCEPLGNGSLSACTLNADPDGTCDSRELTYCPGDGLCLPSVNASAEDYCHAPCDTAGPSTCGAGEVCSDVGVRVGVGDLCVEGVERNELCIATEGDLILAACAPDVHQGRCVTPTGYNVTECKSSCPADQIGTGQGSCLSGEVCLRSGEIEAQGSLQAPVLCDTDADCDQVNHYRCESVWVSGGIADLCVRDVGVCGSEGPILGVVDLQDPLGEFDYLTESCNQPGTDRYCGALSGSDADVQCTELGVVSSEGGGSSVIACDPEGSAAECSVDAGMSCVRVSSGNMCGFVWRGCVAFCTDSDDPNGPDLSCGSRTCTAQSTASGSSMVGPLIAQSSSSGGYVRCSTPSHCNQAEGYTCRSDIGDASGPVCFKPLKVCL